MTGINWRNWMTETSISWNAENIGHWRYKKVVGIFIDISVQLVKLSGTPYSCGWGGG